MIQGAIWFLAKVSSNAMKKGTFLNKWYQNNWILIWGKININPYSSRYTKINLRWITDINIKAKMIKIP